MKPVTQQWPFERTSPAAQVPGRGTVRAVGGAGRTRRERRTRRRRRTRSAEADAEAGAEADGGRGGGRGWGGGAGAGQGQHGLQSSEEEAAAAGEERAETTATAAHGSEGERARDQREQGFSRRFLAVSGLRSVAATIARGVSPPLLPPALASRRAFALAESDGGGTEIDRRGALDQVGLDRLAHRGRRSEAILRASIVSARATIASIFAIGLGTLRVTGGAGFSTIFAMTAACVGAMCAGSPTSSS